MSTLALPDLTLCCIDTVNHALALRALRLSAARIAFGRTLFITDRAIPGAGVDIEAIAPLASRDAYSNFVLKDLADYIQTAHVLLVQWDGYVINPDAWRDGFLSNDYIGAKWFWHNDSMRVGNGGFSLRSRRLLIAARDPRVHLTEAEDITICRSFRPLLEAEYGIRFATEADADRFSFEAAYPVGQPFGFHGLFNFCRVMPPAELSAMAEHFSPAIARSPQLLQLGRNCLAMGLWEPARAIFRRILDADPDHAEARSARETAEANAAAPMHAGRNEPCPCGSGKRFKHCHGAIGATSSPPEVPLDSIVQRAMALHQAGRLAEADSLYESALSRDPNDPWAQHYLGVLRYQHHDIEHALALLQRSVQQVPEEPEFHNNFGLALLAAGREASALAAYASALHLKPDHAGCWNNRGLARQSINDLPGAIDAFRRALSLEPEFAHAHWNLALALLANGDFAQGWSEYDWRLRLSELGKDRFDFPGPEWNGDSSVGKTILLYAEQGLGDAVQFARYATSVRNAGGTPILHCPAVLKNLLATIDGVAGVYAPGDELPRYDAHFPLLSLPRVFDTSLQTIPAAMAYMSACDVQRAAVRERLSTAEALNIGLCWAGSKLHANDRNRSMPFARLAPLLQRQGVRWFSLQQDDAASELERCIANVSIEPLPRDATLDQTAALVAELDLVISVDTSIAHLGAALGRPVWILLPYAPDWRWRLGRTDSPWYPSVRLFRQPRLRDWASIVDELSTALSHFAMMPSRS